MTGHALLTDRWPVLRPHAQQAALWRCPARFVVVEAGRRSGKTELAKLCAVREWLTATRWNNWLGVLCAPTRDQARDIFWEDIKQLCPSWATRFISESHLSVVGVNGNVLRVVGMDKPQRVEGRPIDFAWVDEFADMKPLTWERHLRPALSTPGRPGRAWLFGVPRPSTQFKQIAAHACDPRHQPEWAYFHWRSSTVVEADELKSARATMDSLVFAQEYEATRVNFAGRAYYSFERDVHARRVLRDLYDPDATLHLFLDFNVSPGTAGALQEVRVPERERALHPELAEVVTAVLGEVHIPKHSNSELVARRLAKDWGGHRGQVRLHGDATGGAKGTAAVEGSDWDIVRRVLRLTFGDRVKSAVPHVNPRERSRVNSLNARLRSADGTVRLLVCPERAPHVVDDLDSVLVLEGSDGALDKESDPTLTHLSDGLGYYVHSKFPLGGASSTVPLDL